MPAAVRRVGGHERFPRLNFATPSCPQPGGNAAELAPVRPSGSRIVTELFKLRLVTLVVLTAAAGYLLGAGDAWSGKTLLWTVLGTALAAAGSMALNQRLEMHRDARMERTRARPLPAGHLHPATATTVGILTALLGVLTLALGTGLRPTLLAAAVVLLYTLVYTPLKPRTSANTLIGAVCGAIPPMIGWAAARGELGVGAWLLFAVLFLWQVPHFLALAWMYRADYARGGFRMLPAEDPDGHLTGLAAVLHTAALAPIPLLATLHGLAGWISAAGGVVLVGWLLSAAVRMAQQRSDASARRLFLSTLGFLPLVLTLMLMNRGDGYSPAPTTTAAPPSIASAVSLAPGARRP